MELCTICIKQESLYTTCVVFCAVVYVSYLEVGTATGVSIVTDKLTLVESPVNSTFLTNALLAVPKLRTQ
jgi:hypothetical protein